MINHKCESGVFDWYTSQRLDHTCNKYCNLIGHNRYLYVIEPLEDLDRTYPYNFVSSGYHSVLLYYDLNFVRHC